MAKRAGAWILVIAVSLGALLLTAPPAPGPEDVPEDGFSVHRAFRHVEAIATAPHPVGSEENGRVARYLADRLSEWGYVPEFQDAKTAPPDSIPLRNVLAYRPGTESTGIIAVVAHHDSVPMGPGAADDAAAVGCMLEAARVLSLREPLRNDVLFLFTDGEEAGLLGARAFVTNHPLAREVGLVLNFEARGTSGRSLMFQTSTPNEWLISRYADASRPAANSIMADVYRRMPNDTDFTVFDLAGVRGLNFAFLEGAGPYHTAADTPENLSKASLGHHGRHLVEMLTSFGDTTLTVPPGGEVVYFDVLTRWLVVYPAGAAWPLAAFAVLLFAGLLFVARRERIATIRGVLGGALTHLLAISATTFVVWAVVKLLTPTLTARMAGPVRVTDLDTFLHGAFVAVMVGVAWFVGRFTVRRAGITATHLGALFVWLVLAVASAALLPGASFAFQVPLLFALIGAAWTLPFVERSPGTAALIVTVFAIPGLVLVVPLVREFLVALGITGAFVVFPLFALLPGLLLPLTVKQR
ncbi:MAG: M28 family peptidase [Planctomycetota bacterium]